MSKIKQIRFQMLTESTSIGTLHVWYLSNFKNIWRYKL